LDLFQSIILGIIQGITEFLPVSSTAHLTLTPWLLSWTDPGLIHNVALHFGSLIAILIYFRKEWSLIIKDLLYGFANGNLGNTGNGKLGIYLCIATIPGVISGLLFETQAATVLRSPLIIAFSLFIFSILLILGDSFSKTNRSLNEITLKDCIVIGVAQAFAIIPGASRSGVCITGALFRNLTREDAAKFSFMLGAPLILGATIYESRNIDSALVIQLPFISGVLTSAIFATLAIKYLINFVSHSNYKYFAYYRIVLAIVIIILKLTFH
jgi:undecaprenyl-diphosphatase